MQKFAYTLTASFGAAASAHQRGQSNLPRMEPLLPVRSSGNAASYSDPLDARNDTLSLSETLLIPDDGPAYYRNVVLASRADGSLDLVAAERRKLVRVHDLKVVLHYPAPVQASVTVSGNMTVIRTALEAPLVTRIGSTFVIALAEKPYDPEGRRSDPATDYRISIPLDLSGLAPGEYTVAVNGMESTFVLAED